MRKLALGTALRWQRARKPSCVPCDDLGTVSAPWAFNRDRVCDCGAFARSPGLLKSMVLHAVECDTVPCPFCALKES